MARQISDADSRSDAHPAQGEAAAGRSSSSTDAMSGASARRADAPRFNGSVLPAYVERLRHASPAEL
eukprot:732082-Prymnesium_polylepis.1